MQTIGKIRNTNESIRIVCLRNFNRIAEKSQLLVLLGLFSTGIVNSPYAAESPAAGSAGQRAKVSQTVPEGDENGDPYFTEDEPTGDPSLLECFDKPEAGLEQQEDQNLVRTNNREGHE